LQGLEDTSSHQIVNLLSDQIRREILSGILPSDSELSLTQLQQEYGGNVQDIVQALTLLCTEGLTSQQASGSFHVVNPKETDIVDIIEMRAHLECTILARSMEKGNIHWHRMLLSANRNLLDALALAQTNFEQYASSLEASNKAFHETLAAACDLEELTLQQAKVYQQGYRFRVARMQSLSQRLHAVSDTASLLVEAIIDNDSPKAQRLLYQFITFT
jgi:DNA-binding GntR family transcriptional regulator